MVDFSLFLMKIENFFSLFYIASEPGKTCFFDEKTRFFVKKNRPRSFHFSSEFAGFYYVTKKSAAKVAKSSIQNRLLVKKGRNFLKKNFIQKKQRFTMYPSSIFCEKNTKSTKKKFKSKRFSGGSKTPSLRCFPQEPTPQKTIF